MKLEEWRPFWKVLKNRKNNKNNKNKTSTTVLYAFSLVKNSV